MFQSAIVNVLVVAHKYRKERVPAAISAAID